MSLSMKYLFAVAVFAGAFESFATFNSDGLMSGLVTAVFAVVFLACAWALWARHSIVATVTVGLFLLVDVGGVPFYQKSDLTDWVVQLVFGAIGVVGIVACVNVFRERRRGHRTPMVAQAH
jgi:hypothetical protein